ncbi:MAG: hypothetical protein ABFE07_12080 [Armatimonadia bacterium]
MKRRRTTPAERKTEAELRAFRAEIASCMCCERPLPGEALYCHEIARGCHRAKARGKRFATLVLCFTCHNEMDSAAQWPLPRQLALLRLRNARDYDLRAFNELLWGAPHTIEPKEVNLELYRLLRAGHTRDRERMK